MALEILGRGLERRALKERDHAKSCVSINSFFHEPDPAGQRGLMQNTRFLPDGCSENARSYGVSVASKRSWPAVCMDLVWIWR